MGANTNVGAAIPAMRWQKKLVFGGAGAIVPIFIELLAINYREVFGTASTMDAVFSSIDVGLVAGYLVRASVLFLVGGLYVLITQIDEHNPKKVFQMGIVAPALLTSLNANVTVPEGPRAANHNNSMYRIESVLIPKAYAGPPPQTLAQNKKEEFGPSFFKGLTLQREVQPAKPLLELANTSTYLPNVRTNGRNWWDWTIYVNGPNAELGQIECVTYILHPTFQPPEERVCDRGNGEESFKLSRRGWGTFTVTARIRFKDGSERTITHTLKFEAPRLQ